MNTKMFLSLATMGVTAALSVVTHAQAPPASAIASSDVLSQISMFSYRDGPKSDLFLRGTPIAELAQGKARVEYQDGNASVSAEVEKLPRPSALGPYSVYVLWAVTPDGRAVNQGVIAGSDGGKGDLDTEYGASQFALIVTAEPHFAVTAPSTMITLYNVADDVKGTESKVTTLTERSDYEQLARIEPADGNTTELVQARYALAIADAAGAQRLAPRAYTAASQKLQAAEAALEGKRSERRQAAQLGREAVVAGEDARRAAMIASAAEISETQRLAAATAATGAANEAASIARESTRARTEAERLSTASANEAERERAAVAATAAARADLLDRLNSALPTRDTTRGLVADIGGVNFATGNADINAAARESVAKFSGVIASYPDLRLRVEGHTDSTGSAATNNALSLRRATAIRDFLINQGVSAGSIEIAGLGSSMPTADNATAAGRTANRRVEIVVSGGPLASRGPVEARR
jgi:outer membrane protein OmpA-like peptidoglycan-associated protein